VLPVKRPGGAGTHTPGTAMLLVSVCCEYVVRVGYDINVVVAPVRVNFHTNTYNAFTTHQHVQRNHT